MARYRGVILTVLACSLLYVVYRIASRPSDETLLRISSLEVKLEVEEVHVEGEVATVRGTVSALGAMPGVEGRFFDYHRGTVGFRKIDGVWLIDSVVHEENLRE